MAGWHSPRYLRKNLTTKYLKFWGTRGSCPVSGPEYLHFGGNTPCLELRYDETLLIFDAGTGIRPLGYSLQNEKKIHLFLSHFHWDHILGFPFFKPIYKKEVNITIWTPSTQGRSNRELIDQLLIPEFFPINLEHVQAKLEFKTLEPNHPVQIGPLTLNFHPTHHPGQTLCFKIKTPQETIGYVTDNEVDGIFQKGLIAFHKGADIFIHEAQYSPREYESKQGWGHSSLLKAIGIVNQIRPHKWLVTHHDPIHTDEDLKFLEKLARESPLPCSVEWIPDGYTLQLK